MTAASAAPSQLLGGLGTAFGTGGAASHLAPAKEGEEDREGDGEETEEEEEEVELMRVRAVVVSLSTREI